MELDDEMNWIVKEYLALTGYKASLAAFDAEVEVKRPTFDKSSEPPNVLERVQSKKTDLLTLFDNGLRQKFFEVWDKSILMETREKDMACRNLEFYLHIHFAVLPLRTATNDNEVLQERMNHFKLFLETRGSQLSQTPEFLPFYALPFIPHPKNHPSFQELFTNHWVLTTREKLDTFLTGQLKCSLQSRLSQLVASEKNMQQQSQQVFNHVAELSQRLVASQQHAKKIQEDYQKLIGLSAELIGSLELAVQGELTDVDPIINLCARSFPEIFGGSTNSLLLPPTIQPLNIDKIRADLATGQTRHTLLLLQALRWRVTKCKYWSQQISIVVSYIAADLLGCTHGGGYRKVIVSLISSPVKEICQTMSRLLNLFACFREGRLYLAQFPELICILVDNLLFRKLDSISLDMTLATLQKLSLRRNHQLIMIDRGMIDWLIDVLEDHESLTDYSLEYAVALFMNLCLRISGKNRCAANSHRVLKMLTDLLGNQNQEIVPYVNGALYSVLCVASVRKEARAMAMEDILRCFIQEGNSEMRRQLEFILKQLTTDSNAELESDEDNKDDDEDDDEDEEENQPSLEVDLDRDDCIQLEENEIGGEQLLVQSYLLFSNNTNNIIINKNNLTRTKKPTATTASGDILTNPVTPRTVKHDDITNELDNESREFTDASSETSKGSRPKTRNKITKHHTQAKPTSLPNEEKPVGVKSATPRQEGDGIKTPEVKEDLTKDIPLNPPTSYQVDDYAMAFSTRPKIPRTPDSGARGSRVR